MMIVLPMDNTCYSLNEYKSLMVGLQVCCSSLCHKTFIGHRVRLWVENKYLSSYDTKLCN